MKNFLPLLTSIIILAGCTSSGNTEPARHLKNVSIEYLDFANDFRYPGAQLGYTAAEPYATVCSYSYTKELVNKVSGGFKLGTGGSSVNTFVYSADVTDTLIYSGTTVNVFTRPEYSYFSGDQPSNPNIYKLNEDGRILQFTRRDGYQVNYTYNGDLIIEKNLSGDTLRVFHMENHNLVRITKNYKDNNGVTVSVLETLFEDFDENPNPLKDKYFLVGAFYRSFSKNNFSGITQNYYVKLTNGTLKLLSTSSSSVPISYDQSGYPEFGEYDQ
ncbi:MAG TPA: hypothetical protein PKH02_10630 [Bacteroidales bacterium]|nr:hypothetical protein [Bacteroidales bacterium]HPT11728.1 hypothetical protein [Bacteroidales bacterium]